MGAMDAGETPLSKPTKIGEEVICQKQSGLPSSFQTRNQPSLYIPFFRFCYQVMGESRTSPSGFFVALDTCDGGLAAPEKRLFCLSVSMGSNPCLLVKL